MADKSKIEWTDSSWTPIRARNRATGKVGWHCEHATTGCVNCYSEGMNKRLGTGLPFKPGHRGDIEIFLDEEMLLAPLRWKRPRRIFVCSMTDAFADFVRDEWLDKMFAVMALAPQHTFQVLTKRSARMRAYFEARRHGDPWAEAADEISDMLGLADHVHVLEPRDLPLPNVWLGVSAERQPEADERVPDLLATPASVRFVSAEPLLGDIDFTAIEVNGGDGVLNALSPQSPAEIWSEAWSPEATGVPLAEAIEGFVDWGFRYPPSDKRPPGLDWIIAGGESGPGARPMHPVWEQSIREQCAAAGVAYFRKQWGEWASYGALGFSGWHRSRERSGKVYGRLVRKDCTDADGPEYETRYPWNESEHTGPCMVRVGKKVAGHLLDGLEHRQSPRVA